MKTIKLIATLLIIFAGSLNQTALAYCGFNSVTSTITSFTCSMNLYPNPVSGSAFISLTTPADEIITATLYDAEGKTVKIIADDFFREGNHLLQWNVDVHPGIYFMKLKMGERLETRQVIIQ